jgi:HupE/UreJ protein
VLSVVNLLVWIGRRLVPAALVLAFGFAHAHKPSDSYLTLQVERDRIEGRWDIALRDLDFALGLDENLDGQITWGELRAKQKEIAAYALARLELIGDGEQCPTRVTKHQVDNHSDGAYAVLRFVAQCRAAPAILEAAYSLFFDLDPQHKGLLNLEFAGESRTAIFSPSERRQRFELQHPSRWRQFLEYVRHGVWHIWIGFDHVLFLLSLLLPAVLVMRDGGWDVATSFRAAFWEVLKIVTAFTLAHSITLTLAATGVATLPSRLVESAIAASVVLAAFNNVFPVLGRRRWLAAFGFGLIHGFGFAGVLRDLGLPQATLLLALVGFNLGVELGQIAVVGVFLPLAYALRRTWFYQRLTLVAGSAAIIVLAATWLVERAFNLKML